MDKTAELRYSREQQDAKQYLRDLGVDFDSTVIDPETGEPILATTVLKQLREQIQNDPDHILHGVVGLFVEVDIK